MATTPFAGRSEEHTSELQSLMRISYAVFCLKQKSNPVPTTLQTYSHVYPLDASHALGSSTVKEYVTIYFHPRPTSTPVNVDLNVWYNLTSTQYHGIITNNT